MLKKFAIGAGSLFGLLVLIGNFAPAQPTVNIQNTSQNQPATLGDHAEPTISAAPTSTPPPSITPAPTPTPVATAAPTPQAQSNTYTNVDGNKVESPSSNSSGATGVCRDGTYTHATHHQGACSYHGGVDHWL